MEIQENVPLAPYTTLRIGGPARFFARITSQQDLLEAVRFARANHLPLFTLGGGSNLLVADEGFPGLVLHLAIKTKAGLSRLPNKLYIEASAGEDWDAFTRFVCEQGVCGIECLAGIPGLVGGAPVQNIGAYSQEVAATIQSVHALDLQSFQFVELPASACHFSYRHSIFNSSQKGRYIVTQVDFSFHLDATPNLTYADLAPLRGTNPTPLDVYHFVRTVRARKGMLLEPAHPTPDTRSAGSFFKNPIVPAATLTHIAQTLSLDPAKIPHWPIAAHPESADLGGTVPAGLGSDTPEQGTESQIKLSAAWLIEQAGFPKGFRPAPHSPVGLSTLHTLALTNRTGTATHADLAALRDQIIQTIAKRFHVSLQQEPVNVP